MTLLDRYLFRQTGIPFLLILVCITAVIWMTQILQRVDLMVEDGGSLAAFLRVTILLIPSLVGIIVPFAVLGAALYALNVLIQDNEIAVVSGGGGGRMLIARPLIVLSALSAALVLIINVDLQPRSYRALKDTIVDVRTDIASALIRTGVFTEIVGDVTIYAEEARPGGQYIGLLIHDGRNPREPRTYTAESGLFRDGPDGPRLYLANGTAQYVDPKSGRTEIYSFIGTNVGLATFREETGSRIYESTERYVGELLNPDLDDPYERERARSFIAEGHARLATPLYTLAFGMIAAAALLPAPVTRRGHGRLLAIVVGIAVLLRTLGFVAQNAASNVTALNVVQYAIPSLAVLVALAVLLDIRPPRRRAGGTA